MKTIVLEPSVNTHALSAKSIDKKEITDSVLLIKIKGDGVVTHGQPGTVRGNHGTLRIESENILKYTQQEFNPISRMMMNAFD